MQLRLVVCVLALGACGKPTLPRVSREPAPAVAAEPVARKPAEPAIAPPAIKTATQDLDGGLPDNGVWFDE